MFTQLLQEVSMKQQPSGTHGLVAYDVALEVSVRTLKALKGVHTPGDLADQAVRAAISIPLNIAEGAGRTGGDRQYHFRIAYGSAKELMACFHLFGRLGLVPSEVLGELTHDLDRLCGLLWGLCRK